MKKLLLLAMAVVLVGCGKSKQLTELELKLDDAVERINVLEEALLSITPGVDIITGLPISGGGGLPPGRGLPGGAMIDVITGLPIIGGGLPGSQERGGRDREKGSRDADWAREAIERFHGSGSRVQPKK